MGKIQQINKGESGLVGSARYKINKLIHGFNKIREVYTLSEKKKLADIQAGAEVNVQSDFAQSDNTKDNFILNRPIKAETNLTLTGAVSIDITAKQSYIYNLTGNVDLTIDATNVANNESFVIELRVTTDTGVETLSLLNTTDTKEIYGTYDPTVVNKLVISATKDGSGNVYLTYIFNQPN